MKLVEVVKCEQLPDTLVGRAAGWVRSIGKVPVGCADRAGFIVNSLLIPFLNDVVRASAEGAGTPAELDAILVAEAGHPMGPFQLLDFIGLDVSLAAQETLFAADPGNERLRPAAPLVQRVAQGHLGRKSWARVLRLRAGRGGEIDDSRKARSDRGLLRGLLDR